MILYRILVAHYGPKDNYRSIEGFIVRKNDEQALDYILALGHHDEYSLAEEIDVYDEDYNVIGTETRRNQLLRLGGDYFDADADRSDLYYGHTEWGFEPIKPVSPEETKILQDCEIIESEDQK